MNQRNQADIKAQLGVVRYAFEEQLKNNPAQSLEDVARTVRRILPGMGDIVDQYVDIQVNAIQMTHALTSPRVAQDLSFKPWYRSGNEGALAWKRYREQLVAELGETVTDVIDAESDFVVGQLANPLMPGQKKKGLVLGYVQSGKTSNFTSVIAKAAAEGYRFIIVFAGMHSSLRQQTQRRLAHDLGFSETACRVAGKDFPWRPFTSAPDKPEDDDRADQGDFTPQDKPLAPGNMQAADNEIMIAVVKKNASRLRALRSFFRDAGPEIVRKYPVLLIDDEADQASPNTNDPEKKASTINRLLRDIWGLIHHGTYVAYTATPFANLLMDPDLEKELYPSDFVYAMDKPKGYMGTAEFFGEDGQEPERNAIRAIPSDDQSLLAPAKKGELKEFSMPETLKDATRWFLIATAIRRLRGQHKHSSMLIHTTMKKDPHFEISGLVEDFVAECRTEADHNPGSFEADMRSVFERETTKQPLDDEVEWSEVYPKVIEILREVEIRVDNSESDNRLSYLGDEPVTVIAVGGNTLSRGLTLEGLICSYFVRLSRTYDTLLQMGRWFGFRVGYADLVRLWVAPSVAANFEFLASVETDLRREINALIDQDSRPSDIPIRIRKHPRTFDFRSRFKSKGYRMTPTAKNKMWHAYDVQVSLQSQRLQTHLLDLDPEVLKNNLQVFHDVVEDLEESCRSEVVEGSGHRIYHDVTPEKVLPFFDRFSPASGLASLHRDVTIPWLKEFANNSLWNVVLVSGNAKEKETSETKYVDVCPGVRTGLTSRAKLAREYEIPTEVSIKGLIAPSDLNIDLPAGLKGKTPSESLENRRNKYQKKGLLLLYIIDKDSQPSEKSKIAESRVPLDAPAHVASYGVVFPGLNTSDEDKDYVSVKIENPTGISEYEDD